MGFYRRLAASPLGGFHEWWPLFVLIHDNGITVGWKRIERFRLRASPAPDTEGGG